MKKMRDIIFCIFLVYFIVVTGINRFRNPELTETQLFLRIPKALILDFKCKK